jgi:hypothetical protein
MAAVVGTAWLPTSALKVGGRQLNKKSEINQSSMVGCL